MVLYQWPDGVRATWDESIKALLRVMRPRTGYRFPAPMQAVEVLQALIRKKIVVKVEEATA